MSSSSLVLLLVPLLLAARASGAGVGAPSLGGAAAAVDERREHGRRNAAAERDAFYWKVGRFAVMVYSMWNEISPVPKLESVVSASTRPAGDGRAVDYLLVLRVARLGTCQALVWGVSDEGSLEWKLKYFKPAAGA